MADLVGCKGRKYTNFTLMVADKHVAMSQILAESVQMYVLQQSDYLHQEHEDTMI